MTMRQKLRLWLRGLIAAGVSGGSGGIMTGVAAIGIDSERFNLDAGLGHTMQIAAAAAIINAVIGVAAYLRQSPLPPEE
jgi:hypothetical protein